MKTAEKLGAFKQICDMCSGVTDVEHKKYWSNKIWDKAWQIEEFSGESTKILHKDNVYLYKIMGQPRYLSKWEIYDNDHI